MAKEKEFYGLHHLSLTVADREEAIKFYTEELGFKLEFRYDCGEPGSMVYDSIVSQNGLMLELIQIEGMDDVKAQAEASCNHFGLYVKDIRKTVARLSADPRLSFEATEPALVPGFGHEDLYSVIFRGINGERIELLEVQDI